VTRSPGFLHLSLLVLVFLIALVLSLPLAVAYFVKGLIRGLH